MVYCKVTELSSLLNESSWLQDVLVTLLVNKIQHVNPALKWQVTCPGPLSVDDTQAETSDSTGFLNMLNCSFKREADTETRMLEVVDLLRLMNESV